MTQKIANRYPSKTRGNRNNWIPGLIAVVGIVLFGLAIASFRKDPDPGGTNEGSGTPILSVDQDTVDLGDVKLDQPVQVTFQLKNSGEQSLKFTEAPYIVVAEGC